MRFTFRIRWVRKEIAVDLEAAEAHPYTRTARLMSCLTRYPRLALAMSARQIARSGPCASPISFATVTLS